jgi:hypothetical protein
MDKSRIVRPNAWCQKEIWKLIYGITAELNYVDNPWFPAVVRFAVSRDAVIIEDDGNNRIELRKGVITVATRPCVMFVSRHNIQLYQCDELKEEEGAWIWFDRNVVPFLDTEYIDSEKMFEKLRYIFKTLAGYITEKLSL